MIGCDVESECILADVFFVASNGLQKRTFCAERKINITLTQVIHFAQVV